VLPVHRRRDSVLGGELQRLDHPDDLVEVAARRHRIDQDELDLLIWTDDEDVADGLLSAGVRPSEVPLTLAGNMPYSFETLRSGSPIIGKLGAKSCVSLMSSAHLPWWSTGSTLKPMILGKRSAMLPRAGNDEPRSTRELE